MLFDVSNPFNLWIYKSHKTLNLTPEWINVVYYSLNIFVDFKISDILKLTKVKSIFKLLIILIKKTVWFNILWKEKMLLHSRVLPQSHPRVPPNGLTQGPIPWSHLRVPLHDPTLGSHFRVPSLVPTPKSRSWVPTQDLGPFFPVCPNRDRSHPIVPP